MGRKAAVINPEQVKEATKRQVSHIFSSVVNVPVDKSLARSSVEYDLQIHPEIRAKFMASTNAKEKKERSIDDMLKAILKHREIMSNLFLREKFDQEWGILHDSRHEVGIDENVLNECRSRMEAAKKGIED
jgi:phosphoribosylformylglycinamidine (FGAM) synthase-like enzyme